MVKRVVIGRSGEEKIVDLIKALDERATAGNTSPSGNKVLEYDEDIFWTHDDGREISVRQVEETLSDAEDRITDAEFALQDSVLAVEEAKSIAEQTQIDLDRVETEVIPGAVADLEAADQAAQDQFAELNGKLGDFATDESLGPIRAALTEAQEAVKAAQGVAQSANEAANAASQAALEAAGIAASKGRVIIQETEPTGEDRNAANIWIKPIPDDPSTEIEEKAVTYVYLEASNEWVPTSSDELAQAAQNALDAREAAEQAKQRAETAISNAASAQSAAQAAQRTADQATLDARDAHNEAVSAQERVEAKIASGDSLVLNGSFEVDDTNWGAVAGRFGPIESADAHTGARVMELTPATVNAYPLSDPFPVTEGHTYQVRMWYRYMPGDRASRLSAYYQQRDKAGDRVRAYYATDEEGKSILLFADDLVEDEWTLFAGFIEIDPGVTHLRVSPHALGASTDVFHIDDVQVVDVTEARRAQARADEAYTEAASKATSAEVEAAASAAEQAAKTAAAADAKAKADQAKADALAGAATDAKSKADAAKAAAIAAASADAATKANKALQDALAALADARGEITAEIVASANGKNSITRSTSAASGKGVVVGDLWVQVDSAGDAFRQWYWDGSAWKPAQIKSDMLESLDVHKLQVTGEAKMDSAVIDKLWVDGLSAKSVTTSRLVVAQDAESVAPFPGDWGSSSGNRFTTEGDKIRFSGGRSTSYDYRLISPYVEVLDGTYQAELTVENLSETAEGRVRLGVYVGVDGRYARSIWPEASEANVFIGPGETFTHRIVVDPEFTGSENSLQVAAYMGSGDLAGDGYPPMLIHSGRLFRTERVGAVLIEPGAVTTPKLTVTEDMSASIVNSMTVNTKKLVVTEEAVLQHAKLLGTTIVEDINVTGKLIGKDGVFTGTVDFANINVTGTQIVNKLGANSISADKISGGSFSGKTFSGGLFKGTRVEATNSSGQGAILVPDTTAGSGGLFFSDNGGISGSQAAIYRGSGGGSKLSADLTLRPAAGGAVIAHSRLECTGTITSGSSVTVASDVLVGGGGLSTGSQTVSTPRADIGYIQLRGDMNTAGKTKIANYGRLEQHGSLVYMHNLTSTSSTGNLVISNSSKRIYHGVSSRRYKRNIVDWNPEAKRVLALQPRQWQHDDPTSDEIDETWYVGFIAEEVDELGLKKLVQYVGDGKGGWIPEALNYDRFAAAQQIVLRKHEAEIQELRERIALLESK